MLSQPMPTLDRMDGSIPHMPSIGDIHSTRKYAFAFAVAISWFVILLAIAVGALAGIIWLLLWWWNDGWQWMASNGLSLPRTFLYLFIPLILIVMVSAIVRAITRRNAKGKTSVELTAERASKLFQLINEVQKQTNASPARKIKLMAEPNAAAEAYGWWQSYDLHIGLPLLAVFSQQQLAGVLAHEFQHFRQGWTMRLHCWIQRFDMSLFHLQDNLKAQLEYWFERARLREPWIGALAKCLWICWLPFAWLNLLCLAVTFLLARLLAMMNRMVTSKLQHQQEYHADALEASMVGAECFEQNCRDLARMSYVQEQVVEAWKHQSRQQHDVDYGNLWKKAVLRAPAQTIDEELKDTAIQPFSTHPPTGLRILAVQQKQAVAKVVIPGNAHELLPDLNAWANLLLTASTDQSATRSIPGPQ